MQIKIKPSKDFVKAKKVIDEMPGMIDQMNASIVSDIKTRVPPKVKKAVRQKYGVDKSGVDSVKDTPPQTYKIDGGTDVFIIFEGSPLTLSHFHQQRRGSKMRRKKPTVAPGQAINGSEFVMVHQPKPYTVYAQIIKGQRVPIPGHNVFIGQVNDKELAMERLGTGHSPVKVIKTVSVPQMIMNKAALNVQLAVEDVVAKRQGHQLSRLEKKVERMSR